MAVFLLLTFSACKTDTDISSEPSGAEDTDVSSAVSQQTESTQDESAEPDSFSSESSEIPEQSQASGQTPPTEPPTPPLEFRVTERFVPECFKQYMVTPSLLYGEYIISIPFGENNEHTRAVSLEGHVERDLGFFGWDVKADEKYYYWMDYLLFDNKGTLTKTDKQTLESTPLLVRDNGREIFMRLAMSGKYIAWTEAKDAEHFYIEVYDTEKEELVREIEVNYFYSPFAPPNLCGERLLYVETDSDWNYIITCLDLNSGESWEYTDGKGTGEKEDIRPEPVGLTTDGDRIFWNNMYGIYCYDRRSGEETVIREGDGGMGMALLMDRYLVYVYNYNLFVYDLDTQQLIFEGDLPEDEYYGTFFNINEEATKVVFSAQKLDPEIACTYICLLEPVTG